MNKSDDMTIVKVILDVITFVFRGINDKLPEKERRKGGYFCLFDITSGETILVLRVGIPDLGKSEKYFNLCQEKARRLYARPGHLSSWQSRDESKGQYGGAVLCGNFIFSFSGLPETADEAMMLFMLNLDEWEKYSLSSYPDKEFIAKIAEISNNPHIEWVG